jgi:hypothetical protein
VVGAALALAYKQSDGVDITHDFIAFQRDTICDLTLDAFRKAGICGTPIIEDGKLMIEVVDDPIPARWHMPVYGAWAWLKGRNPAQVSKSLADELKADDYSALVVGQVLSVRSVNTLVRGKSVVRYALVNEGNGAMVGTLPASYTAVPDMPPAFGVVSAFIFDNALVIVAEPGDLTTE